MGWLTEGPTYHGQLYDIPSTGRVVATLLFVDFTDSRAGAGDDGSSVRQHLIGTLADRVYADSLGATSFDFQVPSLTFRTLPGTLQRADFTSSPYQDLDDYFTAAIGAYSEVNLEEASFLIIATPHETRLERSLSNWHTLPSGKKVFAVSLARDAFYLNQVCIRIRNRVDGLLY